MAANKKTSAKKIYTCRTCGRASTSKGHLCAPTTQEKAVFCEFCGARCSDIRHVCAPKVLAFKYTCGTCGRVAVTKSNLCAPKAIPQAKAALPKKR